MRLFWRRATKPNRPVTVYLRDRGVICYRAQLFQDERLLDGLPGQLLRTGLEWAWESERYHPVEESHAHLNLPSKRTITQVNQDTIQDLINDFHEQDVDGNHRFITLYGSKCGVNLASINPEKFQIYMVQYALHEAGPIRMIAVKIEDSDDLIFVPHQPDESVTQLLTSWHIVSENIVARRGYDWLFTVKLESLYKLSDQT